jgi:NAD(P)-dependent dehydrogenase (short-subunit alcohol dehydrogenase family)
MKLLQDKVAIVTGAARRRGIGLATARLFAEHGARVAILDLDAEELRQAGDELGPDHLGLVCDVTSRAACQAAVAKVVQHYGGVDTLVNNAGITQKRGVMDVTDEDYERVLDTNLRGVLHMSQAVIPHLKTRGGGSITCISSLSALQGGGVFGGSHYCAAKAGILGLVRAMALELGPDNIRANGVAPGLILTDFSRGGTSDDYKHEKARGFPLRRVGQPGDIAGACLYLASDLAAYVTGITLDVNGGAYIRP